MHVSLRGVRAGALVFFSGFLQVAYSQFTDPQYTFPGDCKYQIADLMGSLKSGSAAHVKAFVASNSNDPGSTNHVTYSEVNLTLGASGLANWLVSPLGNKQYISNKKWPSGDPFNGNQTKLMAMLVSPQGKVHMLTQDGQVLHTFTPACWGGVMYGQGEGSKTSYLVTFHKEPPSPPID